MASAQGGGHAAADIAFGRLPLARTLMAIGGIYTAQSLVGGLTFQGVPAVLRAGGAALDTIGLMSCAMLPWALKFLWAPAIERYRLPPGAPRRSRHVVIAGEAIAAAVLFALAYIGPQATAPLLLALGVVALASATVDIACDGFAVQQLAPQYRGWGNTAQVGGGYLGILFGSGLFLILTAAYGWSLALMAMAAIVLALTLPFALTPEPKPVDEPPHRPSLAFAWARTEVRIGLLVTAAFESGVRVAQSMVTPFLIDRKVDLATLGILNGAGGVAAGLAGTLLGGIAVRGLGARAAVVLAIALQALMTALLLAVSLTELQSLPLLASLSIGKAMVMAFGFVTLYSLLMGYSSLKQAGVDFTLFQCADAAVAGIGGFGGGLLAQRLGYPPCFGIAAGLSVGALVLIPLLLRRADSAVAARGAS